MGLLYFKNVLDSVTNYPKEMSIRIGTFVAGICDLVTFFILMNVFSNWFLDIANE